MLTIKTPERGKDSWGNGMFGAPRGTRLHMGVDFAAWPESILLSPVKGKVTKHGYPYGDDLSYRYIQIVDRNGWRHRFFYVEPLADLGTSVKVGDEIGIVQDITHRYRIPKGMVPHIHYEIIDVDGLYIDPSRRM